MEQILLAYGIPNDTIAAITILYRNTIVKVRSPDRDTEYFDIVAGVQQGDTLAPYLFIICLDYVLIILEGVRAKNLQATLLFVDFTEAFDSIHRLQIFRNLVKFYR